MENKTYFDLIELVEKQSEVIKQQAEMIAKLTNQNLEQEALISELLCN